jgi:hypothetical protein
MGVPFSFTKTAQGISATSCSTTSKSSTSCGKESLHLFTEQSMQSFAKTSTACYTRRLSCEKFGCNRLAVLQEDMLELEGLWL